MTKLRDELSALRAENEALRKKLTLVKAELDGFGHPSGQVQDFVERMSDEIGSVL